MNVLIKKTVMASVIAALVPAAANVRGAESAGLYVGGNYGYLKVKDEGDFEDENDAIQALVGYNFNPYFAVEGSLIDFGDYGSHSSHASVDGKTLGVKASLPLTDAVSLYAKAGELWWDGDYEVLGADLDADGNEPYYGAGVALAVTESVDINFQYIRYDVDLEHDEIGYLSDVTEGQDLDHASVGVSFKF